jgi:4-amino-4-deoxy-L-arabinose transferase-like glycosyltransferase
MSKDRSGLITILLAVAVIWGVNFIWLRRDTRPPVWDMALHQTYALNYLPQGQGSEEALAWSSRSGNYPPFVHLAIALCYRIFHAGPHIAVLANIPATLLLFWSLYALALDLAGERAARWACVLSVLTPYLIWMSRETVLDYWLSAWVAAAWVALRKTEKFQSHRWSLLFGLVSAFGMLTKWFFAGFLFFPVLYVCIQ